MHELSGVFTVGTGGCEQLDVALEDLKNSLDAAFVAGKSNDAAVKGAQDLFDYRTGFWTRDYAYAPPGGSLCQMHTDEVKAAISRVNVLLPAAPTPARPDYTTPPTTDLGWLKPLTIAAVGAWLLSSASRFLPRRKP